MTYYQKKYGYNPALYKNAAVVSDHGIALPVGPHLSSEDLALIADTFKSTVKEITS